MRNPKWYRRKQDKCSLTLCFASFEERDKTQDHRRENPILTRSGVDVGSSATHCHKKLNINTSRNSHNKPRQLQHYRAAAGQQTTNTTEDNNTSGRTAQTVTKSSPRVKGRTQLLVSYSQKWGEQGKCRRLKPDVAASPDIRWATAEFSSCPHVKRCPHVKGTLHLLSHLYTFPNRRLLIPNPCPKAKSAQDN